MYANKSNTYIQLDTHSKAKEIKILYQSSKELDIDHITINKSNFNISIIRILIVFAIINLIYYIKTKKIYEIKYDRNSKKQLILLYSILEFIIIMISVYYVIETNMLENKFEQKDLLCQEQVMQTESLLKGVAKLLIQPSEELINLEDPYNPGLRIEKNVQFMFDTAYYNENYYSYFGIAPIITLIMPIKLIFNMYLPIKVYTLLFILLAIFLMFSVYKKIIDKYISNVSLFNFILGFITILFSSSILLLLRGEKYDIVCSSGIMFFLLAMFLLIDIDDKTKYKKLKLIIAGLATGFIVLSKPSYILYYLIIFYLLFLYLNNKEINNKTKVMDTLFYIIPLGFLAILQMGYNYARFDSIFEFGAKYQLTSFNMNYAMTPTFGKIIEGLGKYIFTLPVINIFEYPFVLANFDISNTALNELCYQNKLVGLIAFPIIWGFLLKSELKKNMKSETDKNLLQLINLSLLTIILFIILNTVSAGICDAYSIEFKLIAVMFSTITLLKILENKENNHITNKIFLILCVSTLLLFIPLSITTESNLLINMDNKLNVYLKNLFEFWS